MSNSTRACAGVTKFLSWGMSTTARIEGSMQVLQAGPHKLMLLELDLDLVMNIARQAGFEVKSEDTPRSLILDLIAPGRQSPLLLFDAADQANLRWFSRCQFYVEGRSGVIMQTPITLANQRDRNGRAIPDAVRLRIAKELPSSFHLPRSEERRVGKECRSRWS